MADKNPSQLKPPLLVRGTLPKLKAEDAQRLAVYLVRGDEVLARAAVAKDGTFQIPVGRDLVAGKGGSQLQAVVAPAAMGDRLDTTRNLQRVPLDAALLQRAEHDFVVPTDKIDLSDAVLKLWWLWCRNYCVTGVVVGPDHCPVPGAQVTVSTVVHAAGGGFTVTPKATVTADAAGHFKVCFFWCTSCWGWPCWPIWWNCWPWWWEWDILHVLQTVEARLPHVPIGPGPVERQKIALPSQLAPQTIGLPLKQPDSAHLMIGQGFSQARKVNERLVPDAARTELIHKKLADPRIRAIFPWHWWCCENPNVIFTVRQGPSVIVDEHPATDTRWCLADGSNVTLVGNAQTISACGGDPLPAQGFVFTRVGNTLVNTIVDGYAQGNPASNASDMAFTGNLDVFGGFAPGTPVAYYQVNAAPWSGNPAREDVPTPPAGEGSPIGPDLYNYAFMLHPDLSVSVDAVKMGPFNHGGLTNLYATENQRHLVPTTDLPAFPAGTFMTWGFQGLMATPSAASLVSGGVGAVRLGIAAYDSAFAPLALPPNSDDHLTLEIDATGLTVAHINSFHAFDGNGVEVTSTGSSADCPAFNLGGVPGKPGFVALNVSVRDDNGHLCQYQLVPNFGHGSTGVTNPNVRGYRTPTPFSPPPAPGPYSEPAIAHVLGNPATGKAFVGGTENITFVPTVNCCYDFRLEVSKRVTNGYGFLGSYTADFWTATLKVS